jgi:hypothetical protein
MTALPSQNHIHEAELAIYDEADRVVLEFTRGPEEAKY